MPHHVVYYVAITDISSLEAPAAAEAKRDDYSTTFILKVNLHDFLIYLQYS